MTEKLGSSTQARAHAQDIAALRERVTALTKLVAQMQKRMDAMEAWINDRSTKPQFKPPAAAAETTIIKTGHPVF